MEEKNEDEDGEHNDAGDADGIANVGVAMALRQACATHPDLVQSHGPLSVPILRAMLGLDPHMVTRQDDDKAFAIAARAVTLARSLNQTDEAPSPTANDAVRRAVQRRRSSSGEVPNPSVLSSPSSSDLSEGDTYDGAGRSVLENNQHEGGKRGSLSSFLSGSGRPRKQTHRHYHHQQQQRQQQQLLFLQHQQHLLYQQQMQVQMMQQHQLQYQHCQLGQNNASTSLGNGTASRERPFPNHDIDQTMLEMFRGDQSFEIMPTRSMPVAGFCEAIRHAPFDAFTSAAAGSASSSRRGASARRSNSTVTSYSRHQRRSPHIPNTSNHTGGTVAAAFEDLERAVIPSTGSSGGSHVGAYSGAGSGGRRGGSGIGDEKTGIVVGARVPYSSGRSVPHRSGHLWPRRGTPAGAYKGSANLANDPPVIDPDDGRTAPPPFQGETDVGRGGGGGGGGGVGGGAGGSGSFNDSGEGGCLGGGSSGSAGGGDIEEALRDVRTSDATASGSGASATAETSTTPSAYLASIGTFQVKDDNAE